MSATDLEKLQGEIKDALKFCQSEGKQTDNLQKDADSRQGEVIKKINQTEKEIKDMVTKYAQDLRIQMDKEKTNAKSIFPLRKREVVEAEKNLKMKEEEIEKAFKSGNKEIIVKVLEKNQNMQKPCFTQVPPESSFKPGELTHQNIMNIFGSITVSENKSAINLKLLKTYNSTLNFIYRLRVLGDNSVWISNFNTKILRQITFDEQRDKIRTVHEISGSIFDMSNSPNNDIFLSMRDTSSVKMLTKSGKINPVFEVPGLLTRAIHVTKDNRILLGVTEILKNQDEMYKVGDESCRLIIVYGMDGKQKQSLGDDTFVFPYRITTNINKDIIVIDAISENGGRIVALEATGEPKWTYEGDIKLNSDKHKFDPRDIVTTSKGHMVVADCSNNAFHVLSGEGTLLNSTNMKDQGVIFPYSLDIDSNEMIWVGCDTYKGKSDAKLHMMELV